MKKLAMNFLKTADEKLRNIGKHQSGTVVQTQHFTFYKNQPKRDNESAASPQQQHSSQLIRHDREAEENESTSQGRENEETDVMDSRVVFRHGRKERNGFRIAGETDKSEIKRRSRSEGPNRRIRQSMDEREYGKKQTFDGGGRGRRLSESSDSDGSDRNLRQTIGCVGFESESDSDPKKWTKNPLVVRRVKRSDKVKYPEKRLSGTENGMAAKNRDSWVYYGNDDGRGSQGGGNSSSRDSGSSSKGSNKYQKLEEMRKKRINMAVTSDEENTPASRISRLRQRALQGGLIDQSKSVNEFTQSHDSVQWEDARQQYQQRSQIRTTSFVSSDPGINKLESGLGTTSPPVPERHFDIRLQANQPQLLASNQTYFPNAKNVDSGFTSSASTPQQNAHRMVSKTSSSMPDSNRDFSQTSTRFHQSSTATQQVQPQKQAPARPPPPNVSGNRQSFYTIPEPVSLQTTRVVNNSSPEAARKLTTQVRIPSVDSIITSSPRTALPSTNIKQPVTFSNNLKQIQARGSPAPNQELFQALGNSISSPHFNDVVELRLKTTRDGRLEPQQKTIKKSLVNSGSFSYNDDTLDELIESNIQYLDSEYDKGKIKKTSITNVTRSSSLPDPRRMSSAPNIHDQPSIQVQANTSIQFHVSLPTEPRSNLAAPVIQIAPSNMIEYQSDYGLDSHLRSQPDVVPRKYSYDSHSRLSRPSSEYYDRDDMSKSDTQLNAQVIIPSYLGNSLHPDHAYARGCVSDINLRSDSVNILHTPQMDKGMFSDVEYDIEVSERVKKWETFMKFNDGQLAGEKKNINLTTIQENNESESLIMPSEIRKSVLISKNGELGAPYSKEITYTPSSRARQFSSDTCLSRTGDLNALKSFTLEANTNKLIQVVQDPDVGPRIGIQSHSVTSLFHAPVTSRTEKGFMSANELRQQMLANRQPPIQLARSSVYITPQVERQTNTQNDQLLDKRSTALLDAQDVVKRESRYHDELNEISSIKADSVNNLRRRFDSDSTTVTSEDDRRSVSTISAKLSRQSRESPSRKDDDSVTWSHVLPGYENKIKEKDVWSPNLESTQGVPVSIERVSARTLQTMTFSEDPFWKEIEEMTSFDPLSMAGHLSVVDKNQEVETVRSQHQVELSSPHSSTLPNHPRNNGMPVKERMQRSKSLYTPNITPLSISIVEKTPSSAVSALDDVLEDISRSSIERKQFSPKKKALESESTTTTGSGFLKDKQDPPQPAFKFEGGQFTFMKPNTNFQSPSVKPHVSGTVHQEQPGTFQTKQPLQFYQQQRQQTQHQQHQQQQAQNRQSQILPGNLNSYQLDPHLLKQKLISTGLVVDTDTEEPVGRKQSRSSSLGAVVSLPTENKNTAPLHTSVITKTNANIRLDDPVKTSLIFVPNQPAPAARTDGSLAAPWAIKQPGSNALDDIQKALAPFQSTNYTPGPDTLYGTARFQDFEDPSCASTLGSNTTTTSWAYQPHLKNEPEANDSRDISSSNSLTRLQLVNASMDDLKELAQNVEKRINDIKSKLQTADEKSLDSILASLKRLTPEVKTQSVDSSLNYEDYYSTKKSKLSDALTELNRIYNDLELSKDSYETVTERGKNKPYRQSKSSELFFTPQPKSEHLRPMQTRISSVFIPGLEIKTKTDLDKETESEFDILSKSFKAIVDEVSLTSDVYSRGTEASENLAPEFHKQTSKGGLTSDDQKALMKSSTDDPLATKIPPAIAPKPQEVKPKSARFKLKLQESSGEDASGIKSARSKSIPGLDSNTKDFLESTAESVRNGSDTSQVNSSSKPTVTTSSPATRQRSRARPVRDNKIIHDDKVTKLQGSEKGYGEESPKPSPSVARKTVYNNGLENNETIQPPVSFQDNCAAEPLEVNLQQVSVKQQPQILQNKKVNNSVSSETKQTLISSPATQKKVPPPTAAKPSIRSEVNVAIHELSTESLPSANPVAKCHDEKVGVNLQLNTERTIATEKKSSKPNQSSLTTNSLPSSVTNNQSKVSLSSTKDEDNDGSSGGGQKSKRRVGTGVALILDKFKSEDNDDKMKRRQDTRSAPDLSESTNTREDNGVDKEPEGSKKSAMSVKFQAKQSVESKVMSPKTTKVSAQRNVEKKLVAASTDAVKLLLEKPTTKSTPSDHDGEAQSSEAAGSRPSSPSTKPPSHPWKRQSSDPDKQSVPDTATEHSVVSPKFTSRIPRPVVTSKNTPVSTTSKDSTLSKDSEKLQKKVGSPRAVPRRIRPPERKMQTGTINKRPHSFHELISCSDVHPKILQNVPTFRRCGSADEVNSQILVRKLFRPETMAPTSGQAKKAKNNKGKILNAEIKIKM